MRSQTNKQTKEKEENQLFAHIPIPKGEMKLKNENDFLIYDDICIKKKKKYFSMFSGSVYFSKQFFFIGIFRYFLIIVHPMMCVIRKRIYR